jgi:hypothetical protein
MEDHLMQFLLTLNEDRTWTISAHSPKPSANSLPSSDELKRYLQDILPDYLDLGSVDRISGPVATRVRAFLNAQRG